MPSNPTSLRIVNLERELSAEFCQKLDINECGYNRANHTHDGVPRSKDDMQVNHQNIFGRCVSNSQ